MAGYKLIVPDASVIIKWLINETEDLKQTLKFKSDFIEKKIDIVVPSVCFYEAMNTFGRNYPEMALSFLSQLQLFKFTEQLLTLEIGAIAISIMQKIPKASFYDASYHATAIHNKGTFLTADAQYYKKAKKLGNIQLLKDYK